jgi:hypothetical protein
VRLLSPSLPECGKAKYNQSWHCSRAPCYVSIPIRQYSEYLHGPDSNRNTVSKFPYWIVPILMACSARYYQPNPAAPAPFTVVPALNDPDFAVSCTGKTGNCAAAWDLRVYNSNNVLVYGAGFYSFFNDYSNSKLT